MLLQPQVDFYEELNIITNCNLQEDLQSPALIDRFAGAEGITASYAFEPASRKTQANAGKRQILEEDPQANWQV
jgi:hypothetical protein